MQNERLLELRQSEAASFEEDGGRSARGLATGRGGAAFCLDQDVDGIGAAIPEIEADAAVGKLPDGCGDGAGSEIPASGEDYSVARPAETAVEHQFVAVELVANWRGVGFGNAETDRLAFFHWRERN